MLFIKLKDSVLLKLVQDCPKISVVSNLIYDIYMQVRLCRAKGTGEIFAMKKLKKSEMLSRGQVNWECYVLVITVLCQRYTSAQEISLR